MVSFLRLTEELRPLYEGRDPTHGFDHVERIHGFCLKVGETLGADLDLLLPAALVHGLKRGLEGRLREALGERFEAVLSLVRKASSDPQISEERILWDANILDAHGAVWLARAFTKGGYEGQSIEETSRITRENMKRPCSRMRGEPG